MARHVAEAEDVVREALPRVHGALEEGRRIQSPRATSGIGCRSRLSLTRPTMRRARPRRAAGRAPARRRSQADRRVGARHRRRAGAAVSSIVNLDKLRHIGPLADLTVGA
jgi:hypothetical protein